MTWSYSGNPAASELDLCRFMLHDTRVDEPLMQDEEIQYLIDTYADLNQRYFQLFSHAAIIFARDVKRSLGPQSEDPTERIKFFKQERDRYEKSLKSTGLSVPVYAHPKVFGIGMQSNPPRKVDI